MTINWFEGGRRIVSALAALIIIGSACYLFFGGGDNRVVVETSSPSERFQWTLKDCRYPDMNKEWGGTVEFNAGDPRSVTACFRAGKNGQIPYALGTRQTSIMKVRDKDVPISYNELIYGSRFSDEVDGYMAARMDRFKFTLEEQNAIGDAQWKIGVMHFCERATDAFPWLVGLIIGLSVISGGLGWMMRGFAGVPSGQDFRSDENNQAARRNRASIEWIWSAVAGWGLLAGLAWVVTKVIDPAAPTTIVGRYAGKIAQTAGIIILACVGFAFFFGGGMALRSLIYAILNREQGEMKADDKAWLGFSFANGGIVLAGSWVLGNYTVVGDWSDAVYRWGFANGLQDGPQVAICVLFLLWPVPPLLLLSHRRQGLGAKTQGMV
jgi:hypothetical protein